MEGDDFFSPESLLTVRSHAFSLVIKGGSMNCAALYVEFKHLKNSYKSVMSHIQAFVLASFSPCGFIIPHAAGLLHVTIRDGGV